MRMIESDVASSISKVSQVINASVIADFKIISKAKKTNYSFNVWMSMLSIW